MVKRSNVGLAEIADWQNLAGAFFRAASGKSMRRDVVAFRGNLEQDLTDLSRDILNGTVSVGRMTSFSIRDPKPRIIHAPCFRERVLHQAVIAKTGSVLDRMLADDTFACRKGKGTIVAVERAQHHARRFPVFVQTDVSAYFANIDHEVLLALLARRFKDKPLVSLFERIVRAFERDPGKGLPIGALTSQYFANCYLASLDRLLLADRRVGGMVRYMDDVVWWGRDAQELRGALDLAREHVEADLKLSFKDPVKSGQSCNGLNFCGFRIRPDRILLSRRRKRRYRERRRYWESAYAAGQIDSFTLQSGYWAAYAVTGFADAEVWRREQLRRHPVELPLKHL